MAGGNMHCSCPRWALSSLILLGKPFSRCRQFSYMLVLRGAKLCGSPDLSLCAADFLPIPSPVNWSHLDPSKLSLLSPSTQGVCGVLPEFSLLVHMRHSQGVIWGKFRAHLICFPSFKDCCSSVPGIQFLPNCYFCIFCLYFICFT